MSFYEAIQKGDIDRVKLLLSVSNPSLNHNEAIYHAVRKNNYEIVKLLLYPWKIYLN